MQTAQSNSAQAYHKIKDEGLLTERRFQVYESLYAHGPMTRNEVARKVGQLPSAVSARLSELVDRQVVSKVDDVACPLSGHTVALYNITENLPVEPKKVTGQPTAHKRKLQSDTVRLAAAMVDAWRNKAPINEKLCIIQEMEVKVRALRELGANI